MGKQGLPFSQPSFQNNEKIYRYLASSDFESLKHAKTLKVKYKFLVNVGHKFHGVNIDSF